jgi:hypothetical protein
LRNLANVYLRLMYMCSMCVYMHVYMHGFIIQLSSSFGISCLFDINRCKHQFAFEMERRVCAADMQSVGLEIKYALLSEPVHHMIQ